MNPESSHVMHLNEAERSMLETQYDAPEIINIHGESVAVHDVKPATTVSDVPLFFGPGWGMSADVFRDNIVGLAAKGRRALATDVLHGIDADTQERQNSDTYFPDAEMRKATAVVEILNAKQVPQADVVGHSEAGIYLAIAATIHPEKFRNLVLINPAGVIGNDSKFGLILRMSADLIAQELAAASHPGYRPHVQKSRSSSLHAMQEFLKSWRELGAISETHINELLAQLKDTGHGISIIQTTDDRTYPMDKVQEQVHSSHIDGFYSIRGTHNQVFLDPETVTPLIHEALRALEARQQPRH